MINKANFYRYFIFIAIVGYCNGALSSTNNIDKNLYVTWEGAEPDKGASAWLIKTFVNKNSIFKYIKKGSIVTEGIAFDVPFSEFRRTHRYTTFDTLRLKYKLKSKAVLSLSKIIFDLEINTWRKPISDKTPFVKQSFLELRQLFNLNSIPLNCQIAFFNVIFINIETEKKLLISPPAICITLADEVNKNN